jgi:ADP-ribosylglycohydrolase/protein-tyrosine phosphatase
MLGLAVADAVGTTVEFKRPGTFEPVTDMVGGGPFGLPPGAWTDDTSMALCLAESLIERSGFDPVDQLERYERWYREGHWSSIGRCFDIGNATARAVERFERTNEPFPGDANPNAAGNGPLMKLAPVALAYANRPVEAIRYAAESARTTHGAPEAADACRYFAGLIVGALGGESPDALLQDRPFEPVAGIWESEPLHPKIAAVAAGSFNHAEPPQIRGAGYVVDALEAALWALRSTTTFEEGVLAATNLGDDADTTAAIYGQLAGALYGVGGIPEHWRERVLKRDEILELADGLYEMSEPRPLGDVYWVLPEGLLAGAYPGSSTRDAAESRLTELLDQGITTFIDLTEEGEGPPLEPYSELLNKLAAARGIATRHVRLSIRDVDVPTDARMCEILASIESALANRETVYVHCWGGVGRTGTVVGCLLVNRGTAPADALERIAELRADTKRAHRVSPETADQRDFIMSWPVD